jgi:probable HAF family extracellular repeat protein
VDAGGPRYVNMKYFIYSNGQFQDFASGAEFGLWPQGGINNNGQVVGTYYPQGSRTTTAAIYGNGRFNLLGSLAQGYGTYGTAINDQGEAAGYGLSDDYKEHAFLYANGRMVDLGKYSADYDYAHPVAINNAGHVAGYLGRHADGNVEHVFLYKDGRMMDLGSGHAHAMNNLGQIVGWRFSAPGSPGYADAVMYEDGRVINLNTLPGVDGSGWHLANAQAINDRGQIVGRGILNNQDRVFLLEPVYR